MPPLHTMAPLRTIARLRRPAIITMDLDTIPASRAPIDTEKRDSIGQVDIELGTVASRAGPFRTASASPTEGIEPPRDAAEHRQDRDWLPSELKNLGSAVFPRNAEAQERRRLDSQWQARPEHLPMPWRLEVSGVLSRASSLRSDVMQKARQLRLPGFFISFVRGLN
jgi:hypothetical protein